MAQRKDPVARFLEFLSIRTVSGDGPRGAYQQVRSWHLNTLGQLNTSHRS